MNQLYVSMLQHKEKRTITNLYQWVRVLVRVKCIWWLASVIQRLKDSLP